MSYTSVLIYIYE